MDVAQVARAGLGPSAHADTFCRDPLPPPEQWPELLFDLPELRYPDRLNCAPRPCSPGPARRPAVPARARRSRGRYGELREQVARGSPHVLVDDLGLVPGNRVLLRGPNEPVAGRLLARRCCWPAASRWPRCRCCAAASCARSPSSPGPRWRCATPASPTTSPRAAPTCAIVRYGDELTGRCARRGTAAPYAPVDTAADDVALLAFTSGTTGRPKATMHFHRDVLAIADTFSRHVLRLDPGRPVHRHARRSRSPSGWAALVVFPLRAGAATPAGRAAPRRTSWPTRSPSTASPCCSPRPPRTGRCSRPAGRPAGRRCAARSRPASRCRRRSGTRSTTRPGCGSSTGSAPPRCCTCSSRAADDDIRPGLDRPAGARLPRRGARRRRPPGARRRARAGSPCAAPPAAATWPTTGSRRTCGTAGTSPATPTSATPTATSATWPAATT